MENTKEKIIDWEKEFDKHLNHPLHREISPFTKASIRLFIRKLLSIQKQEIAEKIKDWEKKFDELEIDDGGRGLHIPLRLDSEQEVTIKNFIIKLLKQTLTP